MLALALKERFTHDNPSYATWKAFRMGAPPEKRIVTWKSERRGQEISVPRGGFADVVRLIEQQDKEASVTDLTTVVPAAFNDSLRDPLWPHQLGLVSSFCRDDDRFTNGLWRAPQASGKTQAVVAAAITLAQKALIIVSTTSLFEQWAIRVRRELGFEPGVIQGKRRNIEPPITIGMAKTLSMCAADYAHAFGFVALDESQIAGSDTIQTVMDVFTARYRLGVSADERRADLKEFLTYDVFGPVTYEVTREQVERSGSVVDVEVRIIPTEFRADWYVALRANDPSDERQRMIAARYKVHHRARLLEELTGDQERNKLAVFWALQTSNEEGGTVPAQFVLLSDRREQCHQIDALLAAHQVRSGLFIGGADYAQQFELTLAGMKNGSLRGAVGTYQAIGVGFEANRELGVGVAASPCVFNEKSRMQFNQYRGRFARSAPGKRRGVFCYLWDRHVYGINPIRLLCRWNKSVKVWTPDGWVEGKRFLKDA